MHKIDKKFHLGPEFDLLINKKWITISELLHEHSWVNWSLLPEGTTASPMLMSSIGWTRSSLGVGEVEAANFFPVEPGRRGLREAFFAVARS
jgi:hypothetical protein